MTKSVSGQVQFMVNFHYLSVNRETGVVKSFLMTALGHIINELTQQGHCMDRGRACIMDTSTRPYHVLTQQEHCIDRGWACFMESSTSNIKRFITINFCSISRSIL